MPDPRHDGRNFDELRPVSFRPGYAPAAAGSVLIEIGRTRVICAASVTDEIPRWMRLQNVAGGWVTGEYSMLPYATADRTSRESSRGRISGRTHEIQRLIGRSLRAVTDLKALGPRTVWLDCDVLEADGGTRTAAITGATVAMSLAMNRLVADGALESTPMRERVAAVSVGMVDGRPVLDLDYEEDSTADVDMNVVMTESGRFVEVQGSAEAAPFDDEALAALLAHARTGIDRLFAAQAAALEAAAEA